MVEWRVGGTTSVDVDADLRRRRESMYANLWSSSARLTITILSSTIYARGRLKGLMYTVKLNRITSETWWSFGVVVRALVWSNELDLCRTRLVLGWVTMWGFNSRCGTFISVCNQPPRSTQPGHPFTGRRNEYQKRGSDDALRLGCKGRCGSRVGGR